MGRRGGPLPANHNREAFAARGARAGATPQRAPPPREVLAAAKRGRRVGQLPENYNREAFAAWSSRSRANLEVERLDLVQLHCPPEAGYEDEPAFEALDDLVANGHIRAYVGSVEACAQAVRAI